MFGMCFSFVFYNRFRGRIVLAIFRSPLIFIIKVTRFILRLHTSNSSGSSYFVFIKVKWVGFPPKLRHMVASYLCFFRSWFLTRCHIFTLNLTLVLPLTRLHLLPCILLWYFRWHVATFHLASYVGTSHDTFPVCFSLWCLNFHSMIWSVYSSPLACVRCSVVRCFYSWTCTLVALRTGYPVCPLPYATLPSMVVLSVTYLVSLTSPTLCSLSGYVVGFSVGWRDVAHPCGLVLSLFVFIIWNIGANLDSTGFVRESAWISLPGIHAILSSSPSS